MTNKIKVTLERMGPQGFETIEVEIDAWGNLSATVQGIEGPACEGVSAFIDDLGQVVEDRTTMDYYAQGSLSESNFDFDMGGSS